MEKTIGYDRMQDGLDVLETGSDECTPDRYALQARASSSAKQQPTGNAMASEIRTSFFHCFRKDISVFNKKV